MTAVAKFGSSRNWLSLDADEVVQLTTSFRSLFNDKPTVVKRQAGIFETNLRFGNDITSEELISDIGNRLTTRTRKSLLTFQKNSEIGFVLIFHTTVLISFNYQPVNFNETEARNFLLLLERLVQTRALERFPSNKQIPLYLEVIGSLPATLIGVVASCIFFFLFPINILLAIPNTQGKIGGLIALAIEYLAIAIFIAWGYFGSRSDYELRISEDHITRNSKVTIKVETKREITVLPKGLDKEIVLEGTKKEIPISLNRSENKLDIEILIGGKKETNSYQIYRLSEEQLAKEQVKVPTHMCYEETVKEGLSIISILSIENSDALILVNNSCSRAVAEPKLRKAAEGAERNREVLLYYSKDSEIPPGESR